MILEFSVENYRSIKDEITFSMVAESGKFKKDNTFTIETISGQKIKILKTAVIYGANASGKTSFIRAFHAFKFFITESSSYNIGDDLWCYEPFRLDTSTELSPTVFTLTFLTDDLIKHKYSVKFIRDEIIEEKLFYYPKGQQKKIFNRSNKNVSKKNSEIHTITLSKDFKNQKINVFKNQLVLSKFGTDIPDEYLSNIFLYFKKLEIWNATNKIRVNRLRDEMSKEILNDEKFAARLSKLLKIADTKIESISTKEAKDDDFSFPDFFPDDLKEKFIEDNKIKTFTLHKLYNNEQEIGAREFELKEESEGTKILFALGGIILKKLQNGGIILFDELDNSLHPKLSKFLVRLFNNPISNPNNAQLIFATHEVTLLDKNIFRKDQIWFAQKNKFGVSDIFSVKEFEGVRENTPFDKWYENGKFGGIPKIKEVEFIFGNE